MKKEDLPFDIDLEIRPLVEALVERGVNTNYSCQGGSGHESRSPSVGFDVQSIDDALVVGKILRTLGHVNFDVTIRVICKGIDPKISGCPFGWIRLHEPPKPTYRSKIP